MSHKNHVFNQKQAFNGALSDRGGVPSDARSDITFDQQTPEKKIKRGLSSNFSQFTPHQFQSPAPVLEAPGSGAMKRRLSRYNSQSGLDLKSVGLQKQGEDD